MRSGKSNQSSLLRTPQTTSDSDSDEGPTKNEVTIGGSRHFSHWSGGGGRSTTANLPTPKTVRCRPRRYREAGREGGRDGPEDQMPFKFQRPSTAPPSTPPHAHNYSPLKSERGSERRAPTLSLSLSQQGLSGRNEEECLDELLWHLRHTITSTITPSGLIIQ